MHRDKNVTPLDRLNAGSYVAAGREVASPEPNLNIMGQLWERAAIMDKDLEGVLMRAVHLRDNLIGPRPASPSGDDVAAGHDDTYGALPALAARLRAQSAVVQQIERVLADISAEVAP